MEGVGDDVLAFDDKQDGVGFRFDRRSAVDDQKCGGAGDGRGFDFGAHFEVKAADMGVAFSVGEAQESAAVRGV